MSILGELTVSAPYLLASLVAIVILATIALMASRRWARSHHTTISDPSQIVTTVPSEAVPLAPVAGPNVTFNPSPPATPQQSSIASVGNVEFQRLESNDLKQVAVVAQALDNQWVPRATLTRMLSESQSLLDVQKERIPAARAEYRRALINAEQVVINRAFLRNSQVVIDDYREEGDARQAFKDLLGSQVIVPWLYREQTPTDVLKFAVDPSAERAWERICQEVRMGCARLSWSDPINEDKIGLLQGRFAAWASSLHVLVRTGRVGLMMKDLGVPSERQGQFEEALRNVSRWAVDAKEVTRDTFYYQFVVADGSLTPEGKYDREKDFSGELKQLADLSYNTNLPDALGRYALTPIDSLPRTALQELAVVIRDESRVVSGSEFKQLLQRTVFDLSQGGAFLKGMEYLTLRDVQRIRATDQWYAYIHELRGLLDHPFEYGDRAQKVYNRYIELASVMTNVAKERLGTGILERWTPAISLVVNLGGAVLTAVAEPALPGIAGKVVYNFVGNVGQNLATGVARLIVGGVADKRAQAALETSVDFMRVRVQDAQAFWDDLKRELEFGQHTPVGNLFQASQDLYDPNINYTEDIAALDGSLVA